MKNLSALLLLSVSILAVSCGGKDDGGSSSKKTFSSDPYKIQTVNCLADTQQPIVICGNVTYQIAQQSYGIMNNAIMLGQQQMIQPVLHQGVPRYKIKVTGSLSNMNMGMNSGMPGNVGGVWIAGGVQSGYPQPVGGNVLYVTNAVVYR